MTRVTLSQIQQNKPLTALVMEASSKDTEAESSFPTAIYFTCIFKVFLWKRKPSEGLNNETGGEVLDETSLIAIHVSASNLQCVLGSI